MRKLSSGIILSGIISQTEAYLGLKDKACHSYGGRKTVRNSAMWLAAGHAYVYMVYGLHFCFNVVTESSEQPEAVLIRAIIPEQGIDEMRKNRGCNINNSNLANGPGKLTQAMMINREFDGIDLRSSDRLWLEQTENIFSISTEKRIGIDYAAEWTDKPLRFVADV